MTLSAAVCAQMGRRPAEEVLLVTLPPVCQAALQERAALELAVALEYSDAEIMVELVEKENVQDAPSESPSSLHALPATLSWRGASDASIIVSLSGMDLQPGKLIHISTLCAKFVSDFTPASNGIQEDFTF